MLKHKILVASLFGISALIAAAPAHAQQASVKEKAMHKATFYNAPRQIQIVDERPIIHDFREAPQAPGMIQLPPPPQGFGGAGGGQGGGAMPGGDGGGAADPVMQLPAGPGIAPYRTPSNPMGALPKSGFGGTNIPARGMGPRNALQNGTTTGVHGAVNPFAKAAGPSAASAGPRAQAAGRPAPVAASYGGGPYTQAGGGATGGVGGAGASTAVSGRLMSRLKGH